MNWRIVSSLVLVALGYGLSIWCLYDTTALSMTLFFALALPFFGLGAVLYIVEIVLELRRHRVL